MTSRYINFLITKRGNIKFFNTIFGNKKKKVQENTDKIEEYMHWFANASFFLVTDNMINNGDNRMKTYMYFYGAINIICKKYNIEYILTQAIFLSFIMNRFSLPLEEVDLIIVKLVENLKIEENIKYFNIGEDAIISWNEGDSSAPIKLFEILRGKI